MTEPEQEGDIYSSGYYQRKALPLSIDLALCFPILDSLISERQATLKATAMCLT